MDATPHDSADGGAHALPHDDRLLNAAARLHGTRHGTAKRLVLGHALDNRKLTLSQLGGLVRLLERADDELMLSSTAAALTLELVEGSHAVGGMLRGLEQHGYLTRTMRRVKGRAAANALWVLHVPGDD